MSIIYKKIFPKKTDEEYEKELNDAFKRIEAKYGSGINFLAHIANNTEYNPIQERIDKSEQFIELAKRLSDEYELDIEINEGAGSIIASYFIMPSDISGDMKKLFNEINHMADDIGFFLYPHYPELITLTFTYRTHEMYLDGKRFNNII